jgi:hypothetical protein
LVLGQLTFYVLLIGGIVWLIVHLVRRSKGGGSGSSHARWQHAVNVCSADPRYRLGQVTSVNQVYPQRGTAAWVTWYGTGQPQNTWFENVYPPVGGWVVVTGGTGPDRTTFVVDRVHDVIA